MSIPPSVVCAVRNGWRWEWTQLMNGLAPADQHGNYTRVPSQRNNAQLPDAKELFDRQKKDLPTLIIGRSCPWAHRTWLIYEFRELKNSLNLIFAKADHQRGQWLLEPSWLGCNSLLELYKACDTPPTLRPTVPALIDPKTNKQSTPQILGNESAQLLEVLNKWPTKKKEVNFFQEHLQEKINEWSIILQSDINDGVYKCGFARNQNAYEEASTNLFNALSKIEENLTKQGPWICGKELTVVDIKLFTTLIRWEPIYSPLFKCTKKPINLFPKILEWRQQFFNTSLVSKTCNATHWREDYFGALFPLNPSNIIPNGPDINKIVSSSFTGNNESKKIK